MAIDRNQGQSSTREFIIDLWFHLPTAAHEPAGKCEAGLLPMN
jgi:hypothetical protein